MEMNMEQSGQLELLENNVRLFSRWLRVVVGAMLVVSALQCIVAVRVSSVAAALYEDRLDGSMLPGITLLWMGQGRLLLGVLLVLSVACMVALCVSPNRLKAVGLSLVVIAVNFLFVAMAVLAFFLPLIQVQHRFGN